MAEALVDNVDRTPETLSPEAIQQDMALEYDSMVFLSVIEQLAVRLSGSTLPTSPALALASLGACPRIKTSGSFQYGL